MSGGYGWTTYAERLEAAGVSWRVYAEEDDYGGCNVLKLFSRFQRSRPGEPLYDKGIAPYVPRSSKTTREREDCPRCPGSS